MEKKQKSGKGSVLICSVLLATAGLLCIALGFSFLPIIGILVGAGLMWFAIYPWIGVLHASRVNVMIGTVSDNLLGPRRIPVAILSARKDRDGFDFDPVHVDPATVFFGAEKTRPLDDLSDPEVYRRSLVDVNGDGIPDLILYFSGDTAGLSERVEELCLHAKTWNGERIIGCSVMDFGYETGLLGKLEYV
ncbi:MAG: hypothetical protein AB9866_16820 [Syntrophobacteraceae bacterium]